jgi:hypothetical protein
MGGSAAMGPAALLRHHARVLALMPLLAVSASSCGYAAEYLLIERFFAASRLRDRTALARFATVIFEPHVNGTVSSFDIVHVTSDRIASGGITQPPDAAQSSDAARIASISLADPRRPADAVSGNVSLAARDVTLQADVRLPDGTTKVESIVITIQRAHVDGESPRQGNWVVTGLR